MRSKRASWMVNMEFNVKVMLIMHKSNIKHLPVEFDGVGINSNAECVTPIKSPSAIDKCLMTHQLIKCVRNMTVIVILIC